MSFLVDNALWGAIVVFEEARIRVRALPIGEAWLAFERTVAGAAKPRRLSKPPKFIRH